VRARRRRLFLEPLEDRRLLAAAPYQNAADPYDVNVDGAADGTDLWLLDTELKANGERSLTNPNGPVQYFWDVNGDRDLTWVDLEFNLRFQTDTLQGEAPKSGGGKNSGSGSGGVSTLSVYTVTLNPVGNVNENAPFSLMGTVSPTPPPGTMFMPTVNWGQSPGNGGPPMQVMIDSQGHFQIGHIYFDDGASPGNGTPSDLSTITLSGSILGSPVSAQTTATVNNVNPVPQIVLTNTNDPQGGPEWQVSGYVQDASPMDKHTVTIDWGDGSAPVVITNLSTNQPFPTVPPHRYAPRQIHEVDGSGVPLPYIVTATIVDDDTGSASWSDEAPAYVFDLDNDAENDWDIDADDDPIEATPPGRFLVVNMDDDNANQMPDGQEAGPVSGEDDLEPLLVGWQPRPDFDYTGWHVVLTMDPPPVLDPYTGELEATVANFYTGSDKSGPLTFEQTAFGPGFDWIIGTDPIPSTVYIEAIAGTELGLPIDLQLGLLTPQEDVADDDNVVFAAVMAVPDMRIGHGISHDPTKNKDHHAFTVANLNDTDGDGLDDHLDQSVKNTIKGVLYEELDLMPLWIGKPADHDPADPAKRLTLTVKSGSVKFWEQKTKETEIADINAYINTFGNESEKNLWVEATDVSSKVKDIRLELKYKGVVMNVLATAVWAYPTASEHGTKTDVQILDQYRDIRDNSIHSGVKSLIEENKGTGLLPPAVMIGNGILMQFTVYPIGVDFYEGADRDRDILRFDISQRLDRALKSYDADGNLIMDPEYTCRVPFPDLHPDATNDDSEQGGAESKILDDKSHMYLYDAPRVKNSLVGPGTSTIGRVTYAANFETFARVDIKETGPERPRGGYINRMDCTQDPMVVGSRVSDTYLWSVKHTLVPNEAGTKLKRTTGDVNETDENFVKDGHTTI
jgi:hypothetical protein